MPGLESLPTATPRLRPAPRPDATSGLPERTFRALGTTLRVLGTGGDRVEAEVLRLEAILTRFHPSPLTHLNDRGSLADPPPELAAAVRHALSVAEASDGLLTPLVLPVLRWAGYRDPWPDPARPGVGPAPAIADWREVSVSDAVVRLPEGSAIDLGGTGKSWIAERCFHLLAGEALLDAGGDVLSRSEQAVAIDVANPYQGEPLQLVLPPGRWGAATSGVLERAWRGGHHLIDPRTRRPADTRFVQATAVHPDLRRAEVVAKLALLAPDDTARLEDAVVLIAFDGAGAPWRHHASGSWERA
jgi:FAD:protein FMN transferase